MGALLITGILALLGAFVAGYLLGRWRASAGVATDLLAGRCGYPLGGGRHCRKRPLRGSDRCHLPAHQATAKRPVARAANAEEVAS